MTLSRLVERAIHYIHEQQTQQPTLKEIAQAVAISELHLQRIFSLWAGISPKRFLQYLTKQAALEALKESDNLLDASLSVGLSGTGRLHDLMVSCEAMTPGEIKLAGQGMVIEHAFVSTPFGEALLAWTKRGICYLQFVENPAAQLEDLMLQWRKCTTQRKSNPGRPTYAKDIFKPRITTETTPINKRHQFPSESVGSDVNQ